MTNPTSTLRQTARAFAIALLMGSTFLGYSAQAAEPAAVQTTTQAAQTSDVQPVAQEASRSETESYSVREAQATKALTTFQGGDTVVIVGGTTIVIVLLIVLIIVLI